MESSPGSSSASADEEARGAGGLAARAAASPWVAGEPHLAEAVAEWEHDVGDQRDQLGARAVELAQPTAPDPRRLARHATAAAISRAVRVTTRLPSALISGAPLRDPSGYATEAAVEAFVDQLALGGAPSAELARLIQGGGSMFPSVLRAELLARDMHIADVDFETVNIIIERSIGSEYPGGSVRVTDAPAVTSVPVSQLHHTTTDEGRPVAIRVRRPRVARDLRTDSHLAATGAMTLQRLAPDAGGMGPLGFVQLVLRQHLESTDMRFEALNLVELGIVAEAMGVTGLVVARPIPGYVSERTLVAELHEGEALRGRVGGAPDPVRALQAVASLTLESALVHGVSWADPAPEHLLVLPDERLAIVGVGTLGRFTPKLRLAGVTMLKSILAGEPEGLIEAMRLADAVTPEVDVAALTVALTESTALDPSTILFGGESGLFDALNGVVSIMLAYKIEPPIEVALLLRTVFALGQLATVLDPSGATGLTVALLPLLPRLPEIIAEAEAAVDGGTAAAS